MFDIRGLRHSSPCLFPHIDVWGFCFWFCIRRLLRASSSSLPAARLSLPPSLSPSLTHSFTHSLTHSHTHSLMCILHGKRGTMCTAKGSDVRPGVPWVSASFAWQAWHNVHCQGVGCTPWRPLGLRLFCVAGVGQCALPRVGCTPWRPLGLRLFCVAGVGQCALPRGRMYALASLGSPPLLRGRRGTMCTAKGSDVRPGVPWVSASFAWQAWHNVHCDVAFAWQAWHNVHCQGVGCMPWRPLGLRLFCVAGVAQCALRRGFCVAGVGHCAHIHFFHFYSF